MGVCMSTDNKVHSYSTDSSSPIGNNNNNKSFVSIMVTEVTEYAKLATDGSQNPLSKDVAAILNDMEPVHQVFEDFLAKKKLLLSIIPKNDGQNILVTVTDSSTRFYYCIRTPTDIENDKRSLFNGISSTEEEAQSSWKTFVEAIEFCLQKCNFKFEPERGITVPRLILHLIDPDNQPKTVILNLILFKHPDSIQQVLPETVSVLFESYNRLIVQNGEQKTKIGDLESLVGKKEKETKPKAVFTAVAHKKKHLAFTAENKDGKEQAFEVPVQRVLDILNEWKINLSNPDEQSKLDFIMSTISNDELYDLDVEAITNKETDAEVKNWIQSELSHGVKKRGWNAIKAYTKAIHFTRALTARENVAKVYQAPDLCIPANILEALADVASYDFDIFLLDSVTNHRPLYYLGLRLFEIHDLYNKFHIPVAKFREFLNKIEEGYNENPYHNRIHASDVLQTVNYFISNIHCKDVFSDLDILTLLTAAIMHDYQHPGLNNNFEIRTSSERAIIYNDQAILENFHCTSFFRLLKEDRCNFLEVLSADDMKLLRDTLIHIVLGTDMGQHFVILGNIRGSIIKEFNHSKREDLLTLMRLLVKCADVSNPTKSLPIYSKWAQRVTDEFFLQGDKEKSMGLSISPFMDRGNPNLPKSQVAFIGYICEPLFKLLTTFASEFEPIYLQIMKNKDHFSALMTEN